MGGSEKRAAIYAEGRSGLARDVAILSEMLVASGCEVEIRPYRRSKRFDRLFALGARYLPRIPTYDLQVFVERFDVRMLPFGKKNVFLPNQEWFDPRSERLLIGFDALMCRSEHAAEIFRAKHRRVGHFVFTGVDRSISPAPPRTRILHVASHSKFKGTQQLLDIWTRNPAWPTLTVTHAAGVAAPVQLANVEQHIGFFDDAKIRQLQNEAWLHIQTSEVEAFGHCFVEAMSCHGVVITTDAPPMNEIVTTDVGALVPADDGPPLNLGRRYSARPEDLERIIADMLRLDETARQAMASRSRQRFDSLDRQAREVFRREFVKLLSE